MSAPTLTKLFDSCTPLARAGDTVKLTPSYLLRGQETVVNDTTSPWTYDTKAFDRISHPSNDPDSVFVAVEGPRVKLEPSDIAGVYPAPGSTNSPATFLPHISLNRRTLPWERSGPDQKNPPWLALLLIKPSDLGQNVTSLDSALFSSSVADAKSFDGNAYNLFKSMKLSDSTSLQVVRLPVSLLQQILPSSLGELALLCHLKRVIYGDSHQDFAIVIGNRLPSPSTLPKGPSNTPGPPEQHTALLVSLEGRSDLYDSHGGLSIRLPPSAAAHGPDVQEAIQQPGQPPHGPGPVPPGPTVVPRMTLIVLHAWSFTPSDGGDFEEVMKHLAFRPNGGVLRFGNDATPAAQGPPGLEEPPLSGNFQPLLDSEGYLLGQVPVDQQATIRLRGPLRPFPLKLPRPDVEINGVAVRAEMSEDPSYSVAFELGRILALGDSAILQALRSIYAVPDRIMNRADIAPDLPAVLQSARWLGDPADLPAGWAESWTQPGLLQASDKFVPPGSAADFTGLGQYASLQANIRATITSAPTPVSLPVVLVDKMATPATLAKQFPELPSAGR
jgi:hypothetical protein